MAAFKVVFSDGYSVTDSAKRLDLVDRLRTLTDVLDTELPDSTLSSYLWEGSLLIHKSLAAWEDLLAIEEHAVILWAAIKVIDFRMFAWSKYFMIDSRVGKTDPSTRLENLTKMKPLLMKQLDDYLLKSGIVLTEEITQGQFIRRDLVTDTNIPDDVQRNPDAVKLQLLKLRSDGFDIKWGRADMYDFAAYHIYVSDTAEIADQTQENGVVEDQVPVVTFTENHTVAGRITDLAPGTYYVVVVVEDINSRVAVSNEVRIQVL